MQSAISTHQPASRDAAFALLRSVLDETPAEAQPILAAAVKPKLQRASGGAFDEKAYGFVSFRDFLYDAQEAGAVKLRRGAMDLEVYPAETPLAAMERPSPKDMGRAPSIRGDLWRAFVDWNPTLVHVYDRDRDRAERFGRAPVPLEDAGAAEYRSRWMDGDSRLVEIRPIEQEVHLGWMREFMSSVEDEAAKEVLRVALSSDRPAVAFARAVRAASPDVAHGWTHFRSHKVLSVIRSWTGENTVETQILVNRPTTSDRDNRRVSVESGDGGVDLARLRARLHRIVDRLPLSELLALRLPLEYTIADPD